MHKLVLELATILALVAACNPAADTGPLRITGMVEVDSVKLAPLIGARIVEINLQEGSTLGKGQVVARLDCTTLELQRKQAEAVADGAAARLRLLENGTRKEDVNRMQQVLKQATISKDKLQKDVATLETLAKSGTIPTKQLDDARAAFDLASARLEEAQQQLNMMVIGARPEEKEATKAAYAQAMAALEIIKNNQSYCLVSAPLNGTVLYRLAEAGEVAAPGVPLGIMADLLKVKVKGFIPESHLGNLRLGQEVELAIDSSPDKKIFGTVAWISSEAEFTPKNIQTQEERIKTVYEFHVRVDNKDGVLKAGMPTDILLPR